MTQTNGQAPPQAPDAERAVIGSILLSPDPEAIREVLGRLSADDIHDHRHRIVFRAIRDLHKSGSQVDATTVGIRLGESYTVLIGQCLESVGSTRHANEYAEIVRDRAERRRRIEAAKQQIADAYDIARPIEASDHQRKRLEFMDCESLANAKFSTEYHVEGVLAKGQQAIAAGGFKTMKTSVLIDLALSVSSGRPFLNKFFTNQCPVGFFCGESGGATVQETADRIALKSKKIPLRNFGVHWCFDLPKISNPVDLKIVEENTKRLGLGLVIIDPAYLCMGLSSNEAGNVFSMGDRLEPLTNLGKQTGATIILCHHNKRKLADHFEPPELGDIAWSGFAEWARQWLLLGRRAKYDPEIGGHHEVWLSYGGSAGHSGLWAVDIEEGTKQTEGGRFWEVDVVPASSARADAAREAREARAEQKEREREAEAEQARQRILQKLESIGDAGETRTGLRDICGIHTKRFNEVFAEMITAGAVETISITKGNNRNYEGYRLPGNRNRTQPDATGQ